MRDLAHEPADIVAAERSRVATEGWGARLLALQAPDGRWGGRAWSHDWTDTFHVLELLRRLGLDPESRAGPAGRRPRPRAGHLEGRRVRDAVGRQPVLRGRGRAVHQRQRRRDRLVLRRGHVAARRPAPRRAASRRRLELRGRERRDGVVGRDDDQRPRGPARARAGDRRLGQGRGGPRPRRGVPARAPAVPSEDDRRGDRPELAPVLVPALVPLRRPARPRLPARRRRSRPTSASPRRSGSSRAIGVPMAGGRSRTSARARPTS